MGASYLVRSDILLGTLPLRSDFLLCRRPDVQVPDRAARDLGALLPRLGANTLIELKGPTDALEDGDLLKVLAYSLLCLRQELPTLALSELSIVIVAPAVTQPFRDEVTRHGWSLVDEQPGIRRVSGLFVPCWILETSVLASVAEPVLTLFSPSIRKDYGRMAEELGEAGHQVLLNYMAQFFEWAFRGGIAMSTAEQLEMEEMSLHILRQMSPEFRLRSLTTEERLAGLPPEELLKRVPAEERAKGLSREEAAKLQELLRQQFGTP